MRHGVIESKEADVLRNKITLDLPKTLIIEIETL